MGAVDTVKSLMHAGVEFAVEGERIVWRNSDGRVTPEVVEELRAGKSDVLGFLMRHAVPVCRDQVPAPVMPFTPPPSAPAPSRDEDDMFRHGRSVAGNPVTWTGRVVRLDDWRQLSAWDRHGPDGRHFCGICRAWVQPDSFPQCHGGNGGAA